MNGVRMIAVALLVASVAVADDKKSAETAAKEELTKLEGTWQATAAEMAGRPYKPKETGMEKVRIKGTKMTFLAGDKEVATFEISVVPSKGPKHMDWVKDRKLAPLPCIYELKGDELKICFPLLSGKGEKFKIEFKRPEKFETKGLPVGMIVLKREKS